jgi:hypothetical protein
MEPIVGQIPIPDAVNVLRTRACGSRPIHPRVIGVFAGMGIRRGNERLWTPTWVSLTGRVIGTGTKDGRWAG